MEVGVAKFDFTKTFRKSDFSYVRVLYHQYLITNHSESILKSKLMSVLMTIYVCLFFFYLIYLSDSSPYLACNDRNAFFTSGKPKKIS